MKFDRLQSAKQFDRLSLYPERFPVDPDDFDKAEGAGKRFRTTVKAVFEYGNSHETPIQTFVYYPHRAADNLPCWEKVSNIDMYSCGVHETDIFNLYIDGRVHTVTGDEPLYTGCESDYFLLLGV